MTPAADILRLEEVAARGWPAPHTEWLGRWLLRASDGWTRRANSVLVLGSPGMPTGVALDHVALWYAARGLPAAFSVPLAAGIAVDADLAGRGWRAELDTDVLTAPLPAPPAPRAAALAAPAAFPIAGPATPAASPTAPAAPATRPGDLADAAVLLADRPQPGWDAVYRGPHPLPPSAWPILTGPPVVAFAAVTDDGAVVATGRGVVTDRWLGLAAIEVTPTHRGRGLARRVTRALQRWGTDHGATRCYLQVAVDNTPALTLYATLGFTHHHRYRQRTPPGAGQEWSRMP